jgi:hypothetical protein
MKYLLAILTVFMSGCATINFQSVEFSCSNLPKWAVSGMPLLVLLMSIALILSEWMSLTEKIKANGIVQWIISKVKERLKRVPPQNNE